MADQAITALPKKTYSGSSQIASTDYLLGIDSAEGYQMLIQDLGEYIINRVTASLAGSTQTLASAISALNSKTKKNVTNLISGLEVSANGCYLFGTGLKQISLQLRSTGAISQDATIFSVPSEMAPADITYTPIFIFDTNSIDTIYPAIMSGVEVRIKKAIPSGKYLSVQILYY